MDIVPTFMPLLRVFTAAMTKPTAESFKELFAGWLFAGRRTVSDGLRAGDPTKHHSAYHRIFASAGGVLTESDSPSSISSSN